MEAEQKIVLFIVLLKGVWCETWSVNLPEKIEALSGSCVTINCSFTIDSIYEEDLTDSAAGMWHKNGTDPTNIVFNSSSPNSEIKGNITGKIKDKNCTTIFYDVSSIDSGNFFFRIVGNNGLKWTYKQRSVWIQVIDSLPKPTVYMLKNQEVLEGSVVGLRCSAKTFCSSSPPTLTWSSTDRLLLSGSSTVYHTELISDLNVTASHLHHGVTFTCTISYQLQHRNTTAQNSITLYVQYSPKNTSVSVSPSNSVLEGSSVTLTCSSDANPAVLSYTWYRENRGQLEQLQTGYNLTFNVTDRTHTGRYYCQARNQHGAQNTSVMLDIQYAPKISLVSGCTHGNVTVYLCKADGNPFPKVEWHLSGHPVTNYTNMYISEERLNGTDLRSIVSLHQPLTHTDTLQCISTNVHGNDSQQINLVSAPQETTGFNLLSVLIGAGIGASVMMIFCVIIYVCKRLTEKSRSPKLRQEDTVGLNDRGNEETIYANTIMQSPVVDATQNYPESLHYSSIDFTNIEPESEKIRGLSSLTDDYAVVNIVDR